MGRCDLAARHDPIGRKFLAAGQGHSSNNGRCASTSRAIPLIEEGARLQSFSRMTRVNIAGTLLS